MCSGCGFYWVYGRFQVILVCSVGFMEVSGGSRGFCSVYGGDLGSS